LIGFWWLAKEPNDRLRVEVVIGTGDVGLDMLDARVVKEATGDFGE